MRTTQKTTGRFEAIQVLHCAHKIITGVPMRFFRVAKGEMTECPEGCGLQKTSRVESGREMDMEKATLQITAGWRNQN
jgi:hypothetical protein